MNLLAVDGNSLLNRSFYGVKDLSTSYGFPTNAIYGFCLKLFSVLKKIKPTHVMVAFDLKTKTFRHEKFSDYKANRKKIPSNLVLQLAEVKKMLSLMGIFVCEKEGFEADDLLGTISRICSEQLVDCTILSGDRDVLQLINSNVKVLLLSNKSDVLFDEVGVFEKFGVSSKQLIEVKALMGDSSDNIPGVRGIGEKTALGLIENFNCVENIFENLDNLNVSKRIKKLLKADDAKKMCFLSKELGTICLNAGLDENLNSYVKKEVDLNGLKLFFEKFELKKFLNYLISEKQEVDSNLNILIKNEPKFIDSIKQDNQTFEVFVDLDLNLVKKKLQSVNFINFLFYGNCLIIVKDSEIFKFDRLKKEAFEVLVVNSSKPKRTTDLKKTYIFSILNGFNLTNVVFSCDVASYLINVLEKNHDILTLTKNFFGSVEVEKCFIKLCDELQKLIFANDLVFLFNEVELPLAKVLAEMEVCGFGVDCKKLNDYGEFLNKKIEIVKNEIWSFCGRQFNINSTKELSYVLFDEMNLPKTRKIKTGYSTDADALLKLAKHSEFVVLVLKYRTLAKLHSTYVVGFQKVLGADGRIHSSFNQTQTRTGRISSTDPNVQNIPIKTEIGIEMRKFFVANPGRVLIDGDYSQIELRILASLSGDEKMIEAFNKGEDIHRLTASHLFDVSVDSVSDEFRRRAKTVNFSVIYGISAFSLAKDIGISVACAKDYIDSFFKGYSKIKSYFEEIVEKAKLTGEVKTMFGRIRKIPELSSKFKKTVALGERIAKNTPIQGTCADLIKMAMINFSNRIVKENLKANLILQVHDELLVEADKSCATQVAKLLKSEMENVAKLKVPLVATVLTGKNWFNCK